MNTYEIKFNNPGILCDTMPENVFNDVKDSVKYQIENKKTSYILKRALMTDFTVQGIEESIIINISKIYEDYLINLVKQYNEYYTLKNLGPPVVANVWLNLQKKNEYRPCHVHGYNTSKGYSFVTYVDIPYNLEDEDKYLNYFRASTFRNGRIEFIYNTYTGVQTSTIINIDKSYEGKTIIFPNSLMHIVYPFYTSNDYRISIAGNINFI